eukprot:m.369238 g.369238  ORF g.369238 m.369238 type:complete len:54 (+) comp48664_c0_seq1:115-276(+)
MRLKITMHTTVVCFQTKITKSIDVKLQARLNAKNRSCICTEMSCFALTVPHNG